MIPRPHPMPRTISKGLDSLWGSINMTMNEYTVFRNLVEDGIDRYLDHRRYYTQQDQDRMEVHLAEAARLWAHKDQYEDDWPIRQYTFMWLHQRASKASRRKTSKTLSRPALASSSRGRSPRVPAARPTVRAARPTVRAASPASIRPRVRSFLPIPVICPELIRWPASAEIRWQPPRFAPIRR
ncbi:uncharacterized protein B0H18DRAFT_1020465 [Fomitopsis serialis]|uniref:uncharacterized protein n=1 Tax=Fomitopsis serialis TaxID=139415 RepID=UPI0020073B08|nr:uncharacterized protein B0H18DRAFT_1020465 [Neoantrodia serialis]KAH9921613.1 hypothetical protein B0H18DRAFT_1020465 [Neoantrodia serialis]